METFRAHGCSLRLLLEPRNLWADSRSRMASFLPYRLKPALTSSRVTVCLPLPGCLSRRCVAPLIAGECKLVLRSQSFARSIDLFFNFSLLYSALQNDRNVVGQQVRNSLEREHRLEAQPVVPALAVHLTHVKLLDSISETRQDRRGFAHRRVNLAGVSDIEAQRSFRQ